MPVDISNYVVRNPSLNTAVVDDAITRTGRSAEGRVRKILDVVEVVADDLHIRTCCHTREVDLDADGNILDFEIEESAPGQTVAVWACRQTVRDHAQRCRTFESHVSDGDVSADACKLHDNRSERAASQDRLSATRTK